MSIELVESAYYEGMEQVYFNGEYAGLIAPHGDRWRAHGSGLDLDFKLVRMDSPFDFASKDEAVAWLLDGAES